MFSISRYLKKLVSRKEGHDANSAEVQELRRAFQVRYHHFKLLLNANNKALEVMSDIEQALNGGQPFGMSFVKSACTAVSVSVMQIIRSLDELAPRKYRDLQSRFKEIQKSINYLLVSRKLPRATRLAVSLGEIDKNMADEVGSKMANLGEIFTHMHLSVPAGFVITALGYQRFMEHNDLQAEIDRRFQSADAGAADQMHALSADIRQLIIRSSVPEDLDKALTEAYARLENQTAKGVRISLRSSALGEDMAGTSFAGQYMSQLNVSPEHIIQAYKEIVASKYTLQAITYRFNRGIPDEEVAMCVGCMVMINASAGGVMYSRNPVASREDTVLIDSVWGLPKSVVDGSVKSDLFVVSRKGPPSLVHREIQVKDRKLACDADEGLSRVELTEAESLSPSLTDDQALKLAAIALKLEEHYGSPQDIEWAIAPDRTIYILQCRPLRSVEAGKQWSERLARRAADEPALLSGGVTASPGAACGPVFTVRRDADILRFPKGAILVTSQPLPKWASIINRSVAVVAEQGSITGHLASVAREFRVPALFGVSGVIDRLRDGTLITVDADGCRIYEGKVESLLGKQGVKANLMEGSPVYEILRGVSTHIVPLNLLDPDAPDFRPGGCRTLHDITRYAHEKSLEEMFRFGKDHHFQERASKQLVCHVPMQLWVLNLDDGFREEVEGKFVQLSNIVSVPMLALWEGMTAVPWQGPPPIDAKGLMSVMFQATVNPHLDPATVGPYADRNYFMISKNFCSLQSRFGFHFSTVETLVGERTPQNYISFQFKGGAADYHRRQTRVVFVGTILEEYGFRVDVKGDAIIARLEGREEEFTKGRLKVLGYLIIHTRQLDMIMSDGASINNYKTKILNDLQSLCRPPEPSRSSPA
jgi:pyruvate,water dikinase